MKNIILILIIAGLTNVLHLSYKHMQNIQQIIDHNERVAQECLDLLDEPLQ